MTAPFYAADRSGVTALPRWRDRLLHLLLPAPCLGCGAPLPAAGGQTTLGLCLGCRGRLRTVPPGGCAACGLPLPAPDLPPGWLCGACREARPAFDRLYALWRYEEPFAAVVQALKFRRLDYLGRHLGEALADHFAGALAGSCDRVVPVPLHWRRRLQRGYNQAERIARPLAERFGLPLASALRRHKPTPPQSLLGKAARSYNLRRAFHVARPQLVRGLRLLLVDDVATSGATLDAAAAALRRAGAEQVVALAAGRTLRV